MFEGRIPDTDLAGAGVGEREDGGLLTVSWAELSARLSAARDLRHALAQKSPPEVASFDPAAARRIVRQGNGKSGVNLDALAHGNAKGANNAGISSDAVTGS